MKSTFSFQQLKGLLFVQSLFALVLAAPSVASAIDIKDTNYSIPSGAYFVSPNGKDTNSGKTLNSPWSVTKAIAEAPSGATIVFRGGTYRNINSIIKKKLTLQAYPHEKPWIKGSVVVKGWVREGNKWRSDGWKYSFPQHVSRAYVDQKYPLAGRRDMVYINGVSLKQVASIANVRTGTFYVDAANNKLYIGSNPAGKTVEATALAEAFAIRKTSSSTVVRGLGFAHYADSALMLGAASVKLENNTFAWNGEVGVKIIAPNAVVRGNTFSYNGRKGLGARGAHQMLLEDNKFSYNNVEHFSSFDASAIKVAKSNDIVMRGNLVEKNFAMGLWVDESSKNATIVNNISRRNEGIGIYFEISHKAIIASNVVHNNEPAGIFLLNASSARIYNNTLANNHANIIIRETPRNNTKAKEIAQGITWIGRDNVIKNNILSNTTKGPLLYTPNCDSKMASKQMIPSVDYNAYYRKSSSNPASVITWSLGAAKCSVRYRSLAAF